MVRQLRNLAHRCAVGQARVARVVAIAMLIGLGPSLRLAAQSPGVHYRYQGNEPPGAIGSLQLQRGGPLPGYFQPVEIKAPEGALISLAVDGAFDQPRPTPLRVGMLIAPVYRFRVTNIPLHPGREVFPTIEVIDRLYPPAGQAPRFPIPIELLQDDLELALEGNYITRVIYLEDPDRALPVASACKEQNWFDSGPGANPVQMADRLGRPMAILRMGGRLPDDRTGPDAQFLAGSPPFVCLPPVRRLPLVGCSEAVPAPRAGAAAPTAEPESISQ
ncbi:MAG: hypothetical protein HYX69_13550 [Planctomycetia bacterium]|nr:hypothetical protein [Planctomycetia bacterium]